jgi:Domain of unknown function (DUF1707)
VSELTAAYQAGRLRPEEFDERSNKALHGATGKELTDLLTDLPADRAAADLHKRGAVGVLATRIVMGASGAAAVSLGLLALANGMSTPAPPTSRPPRNGSSPGKSWPARASTSRTSRFSPLPFPASTGPGR